MICATCYGEVEWRGPWSNMTHTQCLSCGRINNQIVDERADQEDEEDRATPPKNEG